MTRDDVKSLMATELWRQVENALKEQRDALVDAISNGGILDKASTEKTALSYAEMSAEVRMYNEFINLDSLLFGPEENHGD